MTNPSLSSANLGTRSRRWFSAAAPLVLMFAFGCGGGASSTATDDDGTNPPKTNTGIGSGEGSPGGSQQQPVSKVATIRVHYPVGSKSLVLRGAQAPLTEAGTAPKDMSNDTWELSLGEIDAPVTFTPVLDGTPARGPAYSVAPGQTLDVYPHFTATAGKVAALPAFTSTIRKNQRGLRIYLPPSYEENTAARYPVVYMHDGQVIFDANVGALDGAAKGFFGSWKADKVVDEGVEAGTIPEVIIVGVDIIITFDLADLMRNLTKVREQELTPTEVKAAREGSGKGPDYLRMIVEEIKPMIDQKYRTIPDRDHTTIAGSSLGGLISIWAGTTHGDTFGKVLAMSSSAWWDDEIASKQVRAEKAGPKRAEKIYTDTGDDEAGADTPEANAADKTHLEQTARLWQAYRDAGYVDDQTLKTVTQPGAQHKGEFWSARLGGALTFLLGSGR